MRLNHEQCDLKIIVIGSGHELGDLKMTVTTQTMWPENDGHYTKKVTWKWRSLHKVTWKWWSLHKQGDLKMTVTNINNVTWNWRSLHKQGDLKMTVTTQTGWPENDGHYTNKMTWKWRSLHKQDDLKNDGHYTNKVTWKSWSLHKQGDLKIMVTTQTRWPENDSH